MPCQVRTAYPPDFHSRQVRTCAELQSFLELGLILRRTISLARGQTVSGYPTYPPDGDPRPVAASEGGVRHTLW